MKKLEKQSDFVWNFAKQCLTKDMVKIVKVVYNAVSSLMF